VYIEPLRSELSNTFEKAGKGCGDTWPSFLPVLSLDQIWCGKGLKPVRCSHGVTFRSDHRPVLAELAFSNP
jgi:endonuclease/exonuclease/phosphatase family metal-dependent hydrolase